MAKIQWPSSRSTGTEFTVGSKKYRFDGKRWKRIKTAVEQAETSLSSALAAKQAEIDAAQAAAQAAQAAVSATETQLNSQIQSLQSTVNNLESDPSKPIHSGRDFTYGTLVTTNIPANASSGDSFIIEVTGKSYSGSDAPFSFIAQGYLYSNTIINYSGSRQGVNALTYIRAMNYNGYLAFWWPRVSYWNSFQVTVRDAGGSINNRATGITNSADPTSASKRVTIQLNANNNGPTSCTTFTSSGTWTRPSWCTKVVVEVVGAGGGAAGYSESGGAGGYASEIINSPADTVTVTVGGGGDSVQYYAAGGNGGTSSFGGYCSASGGYGSNRNQSHSGGVGGVGSGAHVNIQGGGGTGHTNSNASGSPAKGGASYMGGGAGDNRNASNSKVGNGAPGSGGPGARGDTNWRGAPGESGIVIVWEYA